MKIKSNKIKVLIVSPPPIQQFVRNDMRILSKWYEVSLVEGLRQGNFKKLISHITKSDFILCWFGCRTTTVAVVLSKMFGKKVAVIAGGQDVAYVPEINYGMMGMPLHNKFIRLAFNKCDAAIAVSIFSAKELLRWARPKALCMIYNGVMIPPQILPAKSKSGVLCVARVTAETWKRKGIEFLFKAAKLLPEIPFTLVGEMSESTLSSIIPTNVHITGSIDNESVLKLCSTSKVYVQPSYYESFGVAVAEAMAHGCVPVVTNRGALPEVVGDTGFYVQYGDEVALTKAIEKALQSDLGARARDRVIRLFTLEQRGTLLRSLIDELVYNNAVKPDLLLKNQSSYLTNDNIEV